MDDLEHHIRRMFRLDKSVDLAALTIGQFAIWTRNEAIIREAKSMLDKTEDEIERRAYLLKIVAAHLANRELRS